MLFRSKNKRHIRFDFEFVPYSKKLKNIILELKVVWKIPKKVPNRVQKQLITYSKNTRKRCIVCFLVVKKPFLANITSIITTLYIKLYKIVNLTKKSYKIYQKLRNI